MSKKSNESHNQEMQEIDNLNNEKEESFEISNIVKDKKAEDTISKENFYLNNQVDEKFQTKKSDSLKSNHNDNFNNNKRNTNLDQKEKEYLEPKSKENIEHLDDKLIKTFDSENTKNITEKNNLNISSKLNFVLIEENRNQDPSYNKNETKEISNFNTISYKKSKSKKKEFHNHKEAVREHIKVNNLINVYASKVNSKERDYILHNKPFMNSTLSMISSMNLNGKIKADYDPNFLKFKQ